MNARLERVKFIFKRVTAAICSVVFVISASLSYPCCIARAAALEITGSVAISALIAYLGASGISYSADGGNTSDIVTSISNQIQPYLTQEYGSEENWLNDIRSYSSPLGVLNGGLSLSEQLCNNFEEIREWLITNVFSSTNNVTVDHIAGVDAGVYTCTLNGTVIGNASVSAKTMSYNTTVGGSQTAKWYGTGCYIQIPTSYFSSTSSVIKLSSMPASQEITAIVDYGGATNYLAYTVKVYNNGREIYSTFFSADDYLFFVLSRKYVLNNTVQNGYYGLGIGTGDTPDSAWMDHVKMPGELSSITTPSYTLSSSYNNAIPVPSVGANQSLVIPVGNLINGVDSRLDDVLGAVQEGASSYPDSRVDADAQNVAPAVYNTGTDYALDLTNFFPFCIPWDIDRALRLFQAEPTTPSISWEIPLPAGTTYLLELDLHEFDDLAALARKLELILWVVSLAVVTKYLIKW